MFQCFFSFSFGSRIINSYSFRYYTPNFLALQYKKRKRAVWTTVGLGSKGRLWGRVWWGLIACTKRTVGRSAAGWEDPCPTWNYGLKIQIGPTWIFFAHTLLSHVLLHHTPPTHGKIQFQKPFITKLDGIVCIQYIKLNITLLCFFWVKWSIISDERSNSFYV